MAGNSQDGNPFVDGERPELEAPKRFPKVQGRTPDGTELREPVDLDGEAGEAAKRMERARKRLAAAKASNPFITDDVIGPISLVPDDEPEWAYKWMRDMLPPDFNNQGGADTKNIAMHMNGQLEWELVYPHMISPKWQQKLQALARKMPGLEGANSQTVYRYQDVVLVRTLKEMRDLQVAAYDYYAERQRGAVNAGARAEGIKRGAPVTFEDKESQGFVDFE